MAVNENGVPTPTGYEGQANGVTMPGPMAGGSEAGFNPTGADMSGVAGYQGYIQGVQLNGGPNEEGWNYGADMSSLAPTQAIPTTNNDFGVFEGHGVPDGDDSQGMQIIGRMGNNYGGVMPTDILGVFNAVVPGGGGGTGSSVGGDAMQGIVLGPGSGTYGAGE